MDDKTEKIAHLKKTLDQIDLIQNEEWLNSLEAKLKRLNSMTGIETDQKLNPWIKILMKSDSSGKCRDRFVNKV